MLLQLPVEMSKDRIINICIQASDLTRLPPEEVVTLSPNLIPVRKSLNFSDLILNRAINTCECAKAVPAAGRIVGGKEVSPKYRLPYQVMFQVLPRNIHQ